MTSERTLASLLAGCEEEIGAELRGEPERPISGVAYDSRQVEPGNVFVAIPGYQHDGATFVPDALARGAAVIVAEIDPPANIDTVHVSWLRVPCARRALAALSCSWFAHPSHELTVVGVTGTNGKTTVTALLERLLCLRGLAGRWSTTLVRYGDHSFPTPRTTPEAPELQAALAAMYQAGCWATAIEVSSHALDLHRVDGTRFAAATFTNLSPDHLDFHGTMEQYLTAKAALFARLAPDAPAVINGSDERAATLLAHVSGRAVTYGWADRACVPLDYTILGHTSDTDGSAIRLATPHGALSLRTPMFGRAMVENVVAALVTAIEVGIDADDACASIAGFSGEPGRLETVSAGQSFSVLVDFAHTPGALDAAIEAARAQTVGRVLVVFGCGGDRDRSKRPLMGEIAARSADVAIVTSDNPRSEAPGAIIEDILAGVPRATRSRVRTEVDRTAAITLGVSLARPGDCLLIAGKGHEAEQVFADRTIEFDDRAVAAAAIGRQQRDEAQP